MAGDDLGEYRLIECIGVGAFGQVWKAFSSVEQRHVALKLLPPELSGNAEEMQRVQHCFDKIHHLHHQHICPVYRLAYDERRGYYLVMQLVEGVPLSVWRSDWSPGEDSVGLALGLLMMAASALDYAHGHGVVHRDVKPANMLCQRDGSDLQVVDFGLADQIHTSLSRLSGRSAMAGTPAYMSPEACLGRLQDGRSDQYSLACVAYYLLAGRPPFEGETAVVLDCHRNLVPGVIQWQPAAVNEALTVALAKNPDERYRSCAQLVCALQAARRVNHRVHGQTIAASRTAGEPRPSEPNWTCPLEPPAATRRVTLAFARNTEQLVAVYADGTIMVWAPDDPHWCKWDEDVPQHACHNLRSSVCAAAFTAEGGFLVVADVHELALLNAHTRRADVRASWFRGEIRGVLGVPGGVRPEVCCASGGGRFISFNPATGSFSHLLRGRFRHHNWVCCSHDGRWLVEAGSAGVFAHSLRGGLFARKPHLSSVARLAAVQAAFTPDDRYLTLLLTDGLVRVVDVDTGTSCSIELPDQRIRAFAISAEGGSVLAVAHDRLLRRFDLLTGGMESAYRLPADCGFLAISETNRVAVVQDDGRILLSETPLSLA